MKLADYLDHAGLSQEQFAERCEVHQTMVSQWLTNRRPISAKKALVIERVTEGLVTRHELLPEIFPRNAA
jgi:DNA-binding transcriptional regulator YdaS (Cro superfamily)